MTRAEAIDRILNRRVARAEELARLEGLTSRLTLTLDSLEQSRAAMYDRVSGEARLTLEQLAIGIADLQRGIAATQRGIGRAEARFKRPTLTIGAVGRSGQGKSRFLQTLTGLTSTEIPAARGGFMTGVPSLIRHTNGSTTAEVELHDEGSFLNELLGPYYAGLRLGRAPTSLSDFQDRQFPDLPSGSSTRAASAYDHLRSYRDNLGAYRDYLESPIRVRPIKPEEIIRFVAQHDGNGTAIHDFRAVRRVRITTAFRYPDLGKLAVIDLPGLGDTNLRDEHLLRRALDGEVDIVVFVRRPDSFRDDVHDVDVDLYDIARNALPELAIDRWSFLLLNIVESADGNNGAMATRYESTVRRSPICVFDVLTANCSDEVQVSIAFDRMVEHAVGTVDELDRTLLDRRRQEVAALLGKATRLVADARAFSGLATPSSAWFPKFLRLFNKAHRGMSLALERLVREFDEEITAVDGEFATQTKMAIQSAKETVVAPTKEDITDRRYVLGGYPKALAEYVDEIRARISREFLTLDAALKARVSQTHDKVAEALRVPGRLETLGPEKGREFLIRFVELVPPGCDELSTGLRFVIDFSLSYRGLIQHRVRRALKRLDPNRVVFHPDAGALDLEYMLQELIKETLFSIETELNSMAHEPCEAVFAVVEEFRDRVLRSEGSEDEWRAVYESLRSEIWADEFEALAANTVVFNEWSQAVEDAASVAGTVV